MDPERVRIEIADGVADVRMVRADKHNGLDGRMFSSLDRGDRRSSPATTSCARSSSPATARASAPGWTSRASRCRRQGRDLLGRRPPTARPLANLAQQVAYGWRELPVPVIAALHGACFGGGLQIALGADIRIAAPDARLSVMEIVHGLIPDMSITQTLPRLVGDDVARELVYTGRKVEAAEALELGLVTRIADDPRGRGAAARGRDRRAPPEAIRRREAAAERGA